MRITSILAAITLTLEASSAYAACTTPSANGMPEGNIPILKMSAGSGSFGAAPSTDPATGGEMYFDTALSQMIWCDGTNWMRLDGTEAFNEPALIDRGSSASGNVMGAIASDIVDDPDGEIPVGGYAFLAPVRGVSYNPRTTMPGTSLRWASLVAENDFNYKTAVNVNVGSVNYGTWMSMSGGNRGGYTVATLWVRVE